VDGSGIDVFVDAIRTLADGKRVLTDFGRSLSILSDYQVNIKTKRDLISEAIRPLNVVLFQDRLEFSFADAEQLKVGIYSLAQACARVSCVAYTKRAPQSTEFATRVYKLVESTGFEYVKGHQYTGPFDSKRVEVDYRITGTTKPTAILALGASHEQANEVFRKWSDLTLAKFLDRPVTIYDDSRIVARPEDFARIQRLSPLFGVSEVDKITEVLVSA